MEKEKSFSKLVLDAVASIKKKMDDNPLQRISIPEMISEYPIGKNVLHEAFFEIEGKTMINYQLERRIKEACELLEGGRFSIQQVAKKCGYPDQANFTNDFKKVENISPREWLKHRREKDADNA